LLLHLAKPAQYGRNPNTLHMIRLEKVPANVEAAFSVQATQAVSERADFQAFLEWKRNQGHQ
jgi:hypothetical protein